MGFRSLLVFWCAYLSGSSGGILAATIFAQDFTGGGTVSTYVSAVPDSGQWNAISTTGTGKTWVVTSNALELSSSGSNAAFATRNTDFTTIPPGVMLTFNLGFASSSTSSSSAVQFAFGSNFTTANSVPANADIHSKFGLSFSDANTFSVRDVSGTESGAGSYAAGNHQLTFVTNNSGASFSYLAPDGSTETIANDTWDLWVGTSRQLNDRAATTASMAISDFKFGASSASGVFDLSFDDLRISAIPEPSAMVIGSFGALALFRRRRHF